MCDFSINAFYYDCCRRVVVAPHADSMDDLLRMKLRLISDSRKLAVDFRNSLRIAQFVCRGYEPTATTVAYLDRCADRDVLGMGGMLAGWVAEHLPATAVNEPTRARFGAFLDAALREPRSHQLLSDALQGDGVAAVSWCPSGPGGSSRPAAISG
jgi:hypothetical protein